MHALTLLRQDHVEVLGMLDELESGGRAASGPRASASARRW